MWCFENMSVVYKCARCGTEVTPDELERMRIGIKCPECNYRILYKVAKKRVYVKAI